jgi:hypothetical protein
MACLAFTTFFQVVYSTIVFGQLPPLYTDFRIESRRQVGQSGRTIIDCEKRAHAFSTVYFFFLKKRKKNSILCCVEDASLPRMKMRIRVFHQIGSQGQGGDVGGPGAIARGVQGAVVVVAVA